MKGNKIAKGICLSVALTTAITMLVGCGGSAGGSDSKAADSTAAASGTAGSTSAANAEPGWKKDTSPMKLDWYINETWFSNPEGNLVHEMIKEQTGIDINFIVPVGSNTQKLNTMIASDSLPDMVTLGWYEQQVPQLSTDTYSYKLNELADKYDPYFWKVANPDIVSWYKDKDGNIFGYPCNGNTPEDTTKYNVISNRSFLVRKDIYEAIGKPDMRTPEGFIKALQAAKEKFPKVDNGQPLIPFAASPFLSTGNTSFEDVLLEFLAVPREIDGKFFDVRCANPSTDYINWLKTFRKAHGLGMMPTDVFVDDRTKIEEKIQQGRYFAMLYQWKDAMIPLGKLYSNKPNEIYIAIDGPANSKQDAPKLGVPGYAGWEQTFITKNCKKPDRAIKLMSYGLSEDGQKTLYLGKEGVTYDVKDGKPVIKDEINKLKNSDMATFKQKYNSYGEIWMFNSSMMNIWEPDPGQPFDQYREWEKGKSTHYGLYDNVRPPADTDEGDILAKAENKWGEVLPKLLMAKTEADFDKLWKEYDDYKKSIGYDKALDYQRKKVSENKAKIGSK
ncbi:MAG TPA: extracellular solute-binding protein [Ruminiclostridium sp.]|nr:extracellular solute-binding protein [Ruminiclostridium sp.]